MPISCPASATAFISAGNVSIEWPGINQVVLTPSRANSFSRRGLPTSPAKRPREMSSGESSPPYEPSQPATASTSTPKPHRISFATVLLHLGAPGFSDSATLQPHFFERRRPRVRVDQHHPRFLDPRTYSARPDIVENGREPGPLVQQPLNLVQRCLAFRAIGLGQLPRVKRIDIGETTIGICTTGRHDLGHTDRRVAISLEHAHA